MAILTKKSVPRDARGVPVMPLIVKGVRVLSLGVIDFTRPQFHGPRTIWPIGFMSERSYFSTRDPLARVTYVSSIEDGGTGPVFVVASADFSPPVRERKINLAWTEVQRRVNERKAELNAPRAAAVPIPLPPLTLVAKDSKEEAKEDKEKAAKKRMRSALSGLEMFGLADPVVRALLEEMPEARKLTQYTFSDVAPADPKPKPPGPPAAFAMQAFTAALETSSISSGGINISSVPRRGSHSAGETSALNYHHKNPHDEAVAAPASPPPSQSAKRVEMERSAKSPAAAKKSANLLEKIGSDGAVKEGTAKDKGTAKDSAGAKRPSWKEVRARLDECVKITVVLDNAGASTDTGRGAGIVVHSIVYCAHFFNSRRA